MRLASGVLWLGCLLLGASCGQTSSSSGSNSNWLKPCLADAECGDALACVCNVCTRGCEEDEDCSDPRAACRASDELCSTGGGRRACFVGCDTEETCTSLSEALVCHEQHCIGGESVEPPLQSPLSVVSGELFHCVTRNGSVWCWGDNTAGQLAVPQERVGRSSEEPALVPGLRRVVELDAGALHVCARTDEGQVWCWGGNRNGQTGSASAPKGTCQNGVLDTDMNEPCVPAPARVAGIDSAVELALSDDASCARLSDGTLRCWGETTAFADFADAAEGVQALALDQVRLCVVDGERHVRCSSALPEGDGDFEAAELAVQRFRGVATEPGNLCARSVSGAVRCWGEGSRGELGDGELSDAGELRGGDAIDENATQISQGKAHTCAVMSGGDVRCWGVNTSGELGLPALASPNVGADTVESRPQSVSGLPAVRQVSAGDQQTCAVTENETLWCWGWTNWMPVQLRGPWEEGAASACGERTLEAQRQLAAASAQASGACRTAQDCAEVPLTVSCAPSCGTRLASVPAAAALSAELARIDEDVCQRASETCELPREPACAPERGELACVAGQCVRWDPQTSGCNDICQCETERITYQLLANECAGHNIASLGGLPCYDCETPRVFVSLLNRGDTRYQGPVTIALENEPDQSPPITPPAPKTVEVDLAPGETTVVPFDIDSVPGSARIRVTSPEDCQPLDDFSSSVTFLERAICE